LQYGIVAINDPVSTLTLEKDFLGREYFTHGERIVLWVTDDPVSILDVIVIDWDHLNVSR
jgi:hypothetical protein